MAIVGPVEEVTPTECLTVGDPGCLSDTVAIMSTTCVDGMECTTETILTFPFQICVETSDLGCTGGSGPLDIRGSGSDSGSNSGSIS